MCSSTCSTSCSINCGSSCVETCYDSCGGSCSSSCVTSCSGTCSFGCKADACAFGCAQGCASTCYVACGATCYDTCTSSCVGECTTGCGSGCTNLVTNTFTRGDGVDAFYTYKNDTIEDEIRDVKGTVIGEEELDAVKNISGKTIRDIVNKRNSKVYSESYSDTISGKVEEVHKVPNYNASQHRYNGEIYADAAPVTAGTTSLPRPYKRSLVNGVLKAVRVNGIPVYQDVNKAFVILDSSGNIINNVKTLSDSTLRSGSAYYYAPVVEDANGKRSYNKANKKKISGNTNSADDLVNWIKSS